MLCRYQLCMCGVMATTRSLPVNQGTWGLGGGGCCTTVGQGVLHCAPVFINTHAVLTVTNVPAIAKSQTQVTPQSTDLDGMKQAKSNYRHHVEKTFFTLSMAFILNVVPLPSELLAPSE